MAVNLPDSWVAAPLSGDDEEDDDDLQRQGPEGAGDARSEIQVYSLPDEDMEVVNVEKGGRKAQYLDAEIGRPWERQSSIPLGTMPKTGRGVIDFGRERKEFSAAETFDSGHYHQHLRILPLKRGRIEFDTGIGEVYGTGKRTFSSWPHAYSASEQLARQGQGQGQSEAECNQAMARSGRMPTQQVTGNRWPIDETYTHTSRSQGREYGILGGGPASQLRERGKPPGPCALQIAERVPQGKPCPPSHGYYVEQVHLNLEAQERSGLEHIGRLEGVPRVSPDSLGRILDDNITIGSEFSRLHWAMINFCQAHELTVQQMQCRTEALECVRVAVHDIWPGAEVHLFGSTATGLALPSSDIDIAVMPSYCWQLEGSTTPWQTILSQHLRKSGHCRSFQKILHAKVPLLKVIFKSGITCDISYNARNGPRSVPLIKQFVRHYEALRPLCLILKFFLGQENLNERYTGGLGSFCLITMIISHLQSLGVNGGGHDLGTLLVSFFIHYSTTHNYTFDVVSTKFGSKISKQAKGWINHKDPELLAVEDPLDPSSDIGKGSYKIKEVRSQFLKAQRVLLAHWEEIDVLSYLMDKPGIPHGPFHLFVHKRPGPAQSGKTRRQKQNGHLNRTDEADLAMKKSKRKRQPKLKGHRNRTDEEDVLTTRSKKDSKIQARQRKQEKQARYRKKRERQTKGLSTGGWVLHSSPASDARGPPNKKKRLS